MRRRSLPKDLVEQPTRITTTKNKPTSESNSSLRTLEVKHNCLSTSKGVIPEHAPQIPLKRQEDNLLELRPQNKSLHRIELAITDFGGQTQPEICQPRSGIELEFTNFNSAISQDLWPCAAYHSQDRTYLESNLQSQTERVQHVIIIIIIWTTTSN